MVLVDHRRLVTSVGDKVAASAISSLMVEKTPAQELSMFFFLLCLPAGCESRDQVVPVSEKRIDVCVTS